MSVHCRTLPGISRFSCAKQIDSISSGEPFPSLQKLSPGCIKHEEKSEFTHYWMQWTLTTLNITLFFVFLFQCNLFFWQIEHVSGIGCMTFRLPCSWEDNIKNGSQKIWFWMYCLGQDRHQWWFLMITVTCVHKRECLDYLHYYQWLKELVTLFSQIPRALFPQKIATKNCGARLTRVYTMTSGGANEHSCLDVNAPQHFSQSMPYWNFHFSSHTPGEASKLQSANVC
jgi:hypothetical protein